MKVFWREVRNGQQLILAGDGETNEEEIGGVRTTKRGYDAFAKTFGYDPGRARKGIATMEQAKEFVESFSPWDLYQHGENLSVDSETKPPSKQTPTK